MHLFIELWKPRDTWEQMSPDERTTYMERIGPSIQGLLGEGVEFLGGGLATTEVGHASGRPFYAVWRVKSAEQLERFAATIEASGWYEYFDQVNAAGEDLGLEGLIGQQIGMGVA